MKTKLGIYILTFKKVLYMHVHDIVYSLLINGIGLGTIINNDCFLIKQLLKELDKNTVKLEIG